MLFAAHCAGIERRGEGLAAYSLEVDGTTAPVKRSSDARLIDQHGVHGSS